MRGNLLKTAWALWMLWAAGQTLQGQPIDRPAGIRYQLSLQAPQDYATRVSGPAPEVAWRQALSSTGATYMAVHFARFDLGPHDYLKLSDAAGGQSFIL